MSTTSHRHCMVPPPILLHVTSGPQHAIIIIDISKKTDTLPLSKSVTKTESTPEGYGTVFECRQNAVPANVPIIKRPETLHMPTAEHLQGLHHHDTRQDMGAGPSSRGSTDLRRAEGTMSDALKRYLRTQVFVNISWEGKGKSSVMFWNVVNQHIAPALTRPWKWRGRGVGREGGELSKGSRAICVRAVL